MVGRQRSFNAVGDSVPALEGVPPSLLFFPSFPLVTAAGDKTSRMKPVQKKELGKLVLVRGNRGGPDISGALAVRGLTKSRRKVRADLLPNGLWNVSGRFRGRFGGLMPSSRSRPLPERLCTYLEKGGGCTQYRMGQVVSSRPCKMSFPKTMFLRQCFDVSNEFFSGLRGLGEGALEAMSCQCQLGKHCAVRAQRWCRASAQAREKLSKNTWGG